MHSDFLVSQVQLKVELECTEGGLCKSQVIRGVKGQLL